MIRLICFDIDDTLMDFHKGEKIAFMDSMKEVGIDCNEEDYILYERINAHLWKALEKGEITKELLRVQRFEQLKIERNYDYDSVHLNDCYIRNLSEQCFLFEKAMDVVLKSKQYAELAVTTNGFSIVQRNRLMKTGLISHFKYLFISEEMGYSKPHASFYDAIMKTTGYQANEIICIGDSLTSDMKGAIDSGCFSVWYNPNHLENSLQLPIDYTIDDLSQFIDILEELA